MPEVRDLTMKELSREYRQSARLLRERMRIIRKALKTETDPKELFRLQRRMAELAPLLTQMNDLAQLTAHYYEKGYWRDKRYTL